MATKRKPKVKAQGLGDTIEKVTQATGIDKVVKFIMGEDCGCEERKAKLNAMFPYSKPLCLTEQEYNYLGTFFELNRTVIKPSEQSMMLTIFNRVFQQRQEPSSCASCVKEMVMKLKKVYENYNN